MSLANILPFIPASMASAFESQDTQEARQQLRGYASLAHVASLIALIASTAIVALSFYHGGFLSYLIVPIFSVIGLLSYDAFVASGQLAAIADQPQHFLFLNVHDQATQIRGVQNLANRIFANTLVLGSLANFAISQIPNQRH